MGNIHVYMSKPDDQYTKIHGTYWKFTKWLERICKGKSPVGYTIMCKVEKYVKTHKEIQLTYVDDDNRSTSLIVLIPHPTHGITILYIPQTTNVTNTFFLYENHSKWLIKTLTKMKGVYNEQTTNQTIIH